MKTLLVVILFLPIITFSQTTTFHADSSKLRSWSGNSQASFDRAMKMQWKIKGQYLTWGNQVSVTSKESGFDTIFFRLNEQRAWDTLICKIKPNTHISFVYNSCCDYFDVLDDTGKRLTGNVSFQLINFKGKSHQYLGTIDGDGAFLSSAKDTLHPLYRSPMLPNTYTVAISEIRKCSGKDCLEAAIQKSGEIQNLSYNYQTLKSLVNFTYVPLNTDPIQITYDVNTRLVEIR